MGRNYLEGILMGYSSAVEVFKVWDSLPGVLQDEMVGYLPQVCPELANAIVAKMTDFSTLRRALEEFVAQDKKAGGAVETYEKAVYESLDRIESFVRKMRRSLLDDVDAFDWGTMAIDEVERLRSDMSQHLSINLADIGPVQDAVSDLTKP